MERADRGSGDCVVRCRRRLLMTVRVMSSPAVEAPGLKPGESDASNNGFSHGSPGLTPFSDYPLAARLKAVPFHQLLRTFLLQLAIKPLLEGLLRTTEQTAEKAENADSSWAEAHEE